MSLRGRQQIINIFFAPIEAMRNVLWFSGTKGNGEYKERWDNSKLYIHGFYQDRKLEGEYKAWFRDGRLRNNSIYRDGKLIKGLK